MSSFTIGKKLFLGTGTLVVFAFILGITALIGIASIGDRVQTIIGSTVKKQALAHEMDTYSSDLLSWQRAIIIRGYKKDPAVMQQYNEKFNSILDAMQADLNTIRPLLHKQASIQAVDDMQDTVNIMRQTSKDVLEKLVAGDMDAGNAIFLGSLSPAQKRQKTDAKLLLKAQDDLMAGDGIGTVATITSSRWITALALLLTCLVGLGVMFAVHQINVQLRSHVNELSESAVQIASAANQVSSSSQSLAQGSSEQAATIEETSSASSEINSMAHRNTENSQSAASLVTESQQGFERANQSLVEMVSAMDSINSSSQKISKIIKVIDEIAFQTNILALNAAVEAARAGEAGMGFAVVADEVRNLAQRCAQAARDTADLIEESIQNSNGGKLKVEQVAAAISSITAESSKIKILVDEINLSSVEQSNGIKHISQSVTQMEQVTQSNAANAEESAAAAEQLNAQAGAMKDVVEILRAMVDGDAASTSSNKNRSAARGLRDLSAVA